MKYFSKIYENICEPSKLYFTVSTLILIIIGIQNITTSKNNYCIGPYECDTSSEKMFVFKLLYIVFWTWLLDVFCRAGYKNLSWFLVLYPIILMFLLISLFIFSGITL
ncbi:MAG: hypothetical protein CMF80_05890 [Candidatus Marinimicrobia bacterium]|nr:hypothetical protein [Candidatus Neomarinimicrobiota bacterium]